jgi:4'-phosphopantetheinyl transferase
MGLPVAFRKETEVATLKTLYPVILAVPPFTQHLPGRERTRFLSEHARRALGFCQRKSGRYLDVFHKDDQGAPVASKGLHWSISHKTRYVAGIIAPYRVGIDLERIRDFHEGLIQKVVSPNEWDLSDENTRHRFFRFWTAKEAVLKSHGLGIAGLKKCRIVRYLDARRLLVTCQGVTTAVEHFYFDHHMAAITLDDLPVEWVMM